jgi:hypothetical protein
MIGNAPIRGGFAALTAEWANWFSQVTALGQDLQRSGPTAERPTSGLYIGKRFFDTTLGIPIVYDGSGWIDYAGNAV